MTPGNKTVSVYISEDLRKRAEEAGINLSRTLTDAVQEELARRDAIADTLSDGIEDHEVELEEYTGVITGKYLGELNNGDQVYLTDDERLLVYDPGNLRLDEIDDPGTAVSDWLQHAGRYEAETISGIAHALGIRPRVRL